MNGKTKLLILPIRTILPVKKQTNKQKKKKQKKKKKNKKKKNKKKNKKKKQCFCIFM